MKTLNTSDIRLFPSPPETFCLPIKPYQTLTSFGPRTATSAADRRLATQTDPETKATPKWSIGGSSFPSPPHHQNPKRVLSTQTFRLSTQTFSWVISPKKALKRCPDYKHFTKDDQKSSTDSHRVPIGAPGFTRQASVIFLKNLKKSQKRPYSHSDYVIGDSVGVVTGVWPAFLPFLQLAEIIELSLTRSPGRYRL